MKQEKKVLVGSIRCMYSVSLHSLTRASSKRYGLGYQLWTITADVMDVWYGPYGGVSIIIMIFLE
jgi:hypothetical protein